MPGSSSKSAETVLMAHLFLPWRPQQVLLHTPATLGAPVTGREPWSGHLSAASGLQAPGRREGQCPRAGSRSGREHGPVSPGALLTLRVSPVCRHPSISLEPGRKGGERAAPEHRRLQETHLPASSQGCSAREGEPASFPIRCIGSRGGGHFRLRHTSAGRAPFPGRWNARSLLPPAGCQEDSDCSPGDPPEDRISVPKFDKTPWLSQASFINKPLVPSIPKRSSLISFKKNMNLANSLQVPGVLSEARRNQNTPLWARNKQLCATCREIQLEQLRTLLIPSKPKLPFDNSVIPRMKSHHLISSHTASRATRVDIPTESNRYRLPIMGPRLAVFHGMLSDAYRTLQESQLSSIPEKKPEGKMKRW
ncbi:PREDICTED: uncharacterized protein C1orf105 homolog [Condylura cristata]|uniref:uncharacterized protein C1orf105 homolog n=1 Tax=Condylura cristata TaxID=143302 RepID=UPI000643DD41|nr:PREDICTED: uncharacterized protein C1orf105 homolog [Condylura cristata]